MKGYRRGNDWQFYNFFCVLPGNDKSDFIVSIKGIKFSSGVGPIPSTLLKNTSSITAGAIPLKLYLGI